MRKTAKRNRYSLKSRGIPPQTLRCGNSCPHKSSDIRIDSAHAIRSPAALQNIGGTNSTATSKTPFMPVL